VHRGRSGQLVARARRRGRADFDGDGVGQHGEGVLVAGVVSQVDGQYFVIAIAEVAVDPFDGGALVPVAARHDVENLAPGIDAKQRAVAGRGCVDGLLDGGAVVCGGQAASER